MDDSVSVPENVNASNGEPCEAHPFGGPSWRSQRESIRQALLVVVGSDQFLLASVAIRGTPYPKLLGKGPICVLLFFYSF